MVFEGKWCRRRGLNSRPSVYKTAALPLCYAGMAKTVSGLNIVLSGLESIHNPLIYMLMYQYDWGIMQPLWSVDLSVLVWPCRNKRAGSRRNVAAGAGFFKEKRGGSLWRKGIRREPPGGLHLRNPSCNRFENAYSASGILC